jgi:hypothetical protein
VSARSAGAADGIGKVDVERDEGPDSRGRAIEAAAFEAAFFVLEGGEAFPDIVR